MTNKLLFMINIMKTNTHYETPTTELTHINLEQGFLTLSGGETDDSTIDVLTEIDFSSIW